VCETAETIGISKERVSSNGLDMVAVGLST